MQDYEDFDLANEIDELEKFLKVTTAVSTAEITLDSKSQNDEIQENGNTSSREVILFLYLNAGLKIKEALLIRCWSTHIFCSFLKKVLGSAKTEIAITIVMFVVWHVQRVTKRIFILTIYKSFESVVGSYNGPSDERINSYILPFCGNKRHSVNAVHEIIFIFSASNCYCNLMILLLNLYYSFSNIITYLTSVMCLFQPSTDKEAGVVPSDR